MSVGETHQPWLAGSSQTSVARRRCAECRALPRPLCLEATDTADVFMLDGASVGVYDTVEAARTAVAKNAIPSDAGLVLVRDVFDPADPLGFSAFAPSYRVEEAGLSDELASLVCSRR